MNGEFTLTAGTVLKIIVGQEGQLNPSLGTLQFGGAKIGRLASFTRNLRLCAMTSTREIVPQKGLNSRFFGQSFH